MASELQKKAQEVFEQAKRLSVEDRQAFLEALRREDAGLAEIVTGLFEDETEKPDVSSLPAEAWQLPAPPVPPNHAAGDSKSTIGPYAIAETIGQGGMGIVYRVRDPVFNRSLAVKVLAAKLREQEEFRRRFLEEAQIMGQLQHPGIPPVHHLGVLHDGRPYYAMKLIRGKTLSALLKEAGAARTPSTPGDKPEPSGPTPPPVPGREAPFLGVYEQVCQTVAYAHSRGIIHRDLKPGNIMVGAFGEVQVMDWGLAKVIGRKEQSGADVLDEPSAIRTARTTGEAQTETGQALGTWGFMPPEQARGEIDHLDERCDVFALGAILCVLLTGRTPYTGKDNIEFLVQVEEGRWNEAYERLDACGAESDLINLAKRCLAPRAVDRPVHAGEVASIMSAYQRGVQERLRWAEIDRAQAEVKAEEESKRREVEEAKALEERKHRETQQAKAQEERRRRRATRASAAALLALVLGGAGAALWYQDDRAQRRAEAQQRQVEARLQEIETTRRHRMAEADIAESLRAASLAHEGVQTKLREPGGVFWLLNDPADWQRQIETGLERLKRARRVQERAEKPIDADLISQLQTLEKELQGDEADRRLALRLDRIRLDRFYVKEDPGHQDYHDTFKEAGLAPTSGDEEKLADRLRGSAIREALLAAVDDWALVAPPEVRKCLLHVGRLVDPDPLWPQLQVRDPRVWSDRAAMQRFAENLLNDDKMMKRLTLPMIDLVGVLLGPEAAVCEDWWRRSHALHPTAFLTNLRLGHFLDYRKKHAEATGFYRAALAARPRNVTAWYSLAQAQMKAKDMPGAEATLRGAVAVDENSAHLWVSLGAVLRARGEHREAVDSFARAADLDAGNPSVWHNLGAAYLDVQRTEKAIDAFKQALALDRAHALAWHGLGLARWTRGELTDALEAYGKALAIDAGSPLLWRDLGLALIASGDSLRGLMAFGMARAVAPTEIHQMRVGAGVPLTPPAPPPKHGQALTKEK